MTQQKINTSFIKLDQLLKLSGVVDTGGQAKHIIESGEVEVNNLPCSCRGKKLVSGDIVKYKNYLIEVVSDV